MLLITSIALLLIALILFVAGKTHFPLPEFTGSLADIL